MEQLTSNLKEDNYLREINSYFNCLDTISIDDKKLEMTEFKKILFDDPNYFTEKIDKYPYLQYLTTPNFCSLEDFSYQFNSETSSFEGANLIKSILNKDFEMIINITNYLPEINSI